MTGRRSYSVSAASAAPPEAVFDVLVDAPRWRTWAPLMKVSGWEPGVEVGVGAVRRAGAPPLVMREQVTVHDPPHRHGYTILADSPARDYHALVELTPSGSGTAIAWSGSGEPHPRGLGDAYLLFVRWYVGRLARALAREAERRTGS